MPTKSLPPTETHPSRYRHWLLRLEPPLAYLTMNVSPDAALEPGYELKLNSYDYSVDLELADVVNRMRFEHPEVRVVVVTAPPGKIFCAGANIGMLAQSSHEFKVNFCKFTNETRFAIEDASANSGQVYLAACNGAAAGGGYELALACDEIYLIDDGNSAVSLPETPLLGVLPGTGGLTRLVDKRKVRRDRADVFCTLAEGLKGRKAVEWGLVDAVLPRSRFHEEVEARARARADALSAKEGPGVVLDVLDPEESDEEIRYRHVLLKLDAPGRTATLTIEGPQDQPPDTRESVRQAGAAFWPLRAFRELDDALLRLRLHHPEIGLVLLRTRGDIEMLLKFDSTLVELRDDWFVSEVVLLMARTLRRLDATARSFFAVIDEGSCFAGSLFELALAADRSYMLDDEDVQVRVALGELNQGLLPMSHGASRLAVRNVSASGTYTAPEADETGLVTVVFDDIDWDDELRVAIEERASFSPDALTAMEANLRFAGAESWQTKVMGRLTAWQNWVFSRPNATGERGALTTYGKPERPDFDWRRT